MQTRQQAWLCSPPLWLNPKIDNLVLIWLDGSTSWTICQIGHGWYFVRCRRGSKPDFVHLLSDYSTLLDLLSAPLAPPWLEVNFIKRYKMEHLAHYWWESRTKVWTWQAPGIQSQCSSCDLHCTPDAIIFYPFHNFLKKCIFLNLVDELPRLAYFCSHLISHSLHRIRVSSRNFSQDT